MVLSIGLVLLCSGCTSGAADSSLPGAQTSGSSTASPAASPSPKASAPDAATTEGTFAFAAGASVGVLAAPWTPVDRLDGQQLHLLPGAPGTDFSDEVWGDIVVYVPDAAYDRGATAPEPVPADPVAWTLGHPDLEILDRREVTVDGVKATQIDARAVSPTNWLAVGEKPFEWAGTERVVLIPVGGSWLVVRGSAFQQEVAFAEPAAQGDAMAAVLASVDLDG